MKYILTLTLTLILFTVQAQTPDSTSFTVSKDSVTRVILTKEVAQGDTRIITISEVSGTDSSLMQTYLQGLISTQTIKANDIAIVFKYRKDLTRDLKSLRDFETKLGYQSDPLLLSRKDITKGTWDLRKGGKEWKNIKFKLDNKNKIVLIFESKTYKVDFLIGAIRIYDLGENLETLDLYLSESAYVSPCGRFVLKPYKD